MVYMKILFFIGCKNDPASRFRVLQYVPYLEKEGYECTVLPMRRFQEPKISSLLDFRGGRFLKALFYRLSDIKKCTGYDIVFLQRTSISNFMWPTLEKKLHKYNKNIIFDFDDSIFRTINRESHLLEKKIREIIRLSKYVIVGNEFLKKYVNNEAKTFLIPTVINTDKYKYKGKNSYSKKVVIGWMGTAHNLQYLIMIKKVLEDLSQHPGIEIRVISNKKRLINTLKNIHINYIHWDRNREVEDLQGFDIGIMPLPNNTWTKGKCGFKLIQYMSVGLPVVCSPVGANTKIVEDEVNGFFAKTIREWHDKILFLANNKELRRKMGKRGREKVERKYSILSSLPKLIEVFSKFENINSASFKREKLNDRRL